MALFCQKGKMPSRKFKKRLERARLNNVDVDGGNGQVPIDGNVLYRRLNDGRSVSFEGKRYNPPPSETQSISHNKEG